MISLVFNVYHSQLKTSEWEKDVDRIIGSIGSGTPESKKAWREALAEQEADERANAPSVLTPFPVND